MLRSPLASLLVLCIPVASAVPAAAQVLTRESFGSGCSVPNGDSRGGGLSAGGRWVVYSSRGSGLAPGDANGEHDVFLRDRWTRTTTCISVDPAGVPGNGLSFATDAATPDGRWVVFHSLASNLVPGDTNGTFDVFVRDVALGATARVSVATGGGQGNGSSSDAVISDDGRFVAFISQASNLVAGDPGAQFDVFLHDRDPDANGSFDEGNGTTACLSVVPATGLPSNALSTGPQISSDGSRVAYNAVGDVVAPGDANGVADVVLWDRASGTTTVLSVATGGAQGDQVSTRVSLSADGLRASFASRATNLVPGGDGNATWDVYVRDLVLGTTELASPGSGFEGAYASVISGDGRYVAIESTGHLAPGDLDSNYDVYLRDRQTGTTTLLTPGLSNCLEPDVSSDGGFVVWTASSGLVPDDVDSFDDVYVLDRGATQPAQVASCSGDGTAGPCPCGNAGPPVAGCAHSQGGAARLAAYGTTSPDRVVLAVHGAVTSALTIFLQGDTPSAPIAFGDGLRCFGGKLLRLGVTSAWYGSAYYPACPLPASILARSAELGDPIAPGSTRHYAAYYRDPQAGFCPAPAGGTFNASNAVSISW